MRAPFTVNLLNKKVLWMSVLSDQILCFARGESIQSLIDPSLLSQSKAAPDTDPPSWRGHCCVLQEASTRCNKPYREKPLPILDSDQAWKVLTRHWLQRAGFILEVYRSDGQPYGFSRSGGCVQGHVDGILRKAPEKLGMAVPAIWECKSFNAKGWQDIVSKGLRQVRPIYAVQIALYQAFMEKSVPGVRRNPAFLTAINKDTCELYHERVPFEAGLVQAASDKTRMILRALAKEWLPPFSHDPESFGCCFCKCHQICWQETV